MLLEVQVKMRSMLQEQSASDGMNISIPQFLDLFRQNESKSIVMIPIDDSGRPLPGIAIPQKVLILIINFGVGNISEIINRKRTG